MSLSKAEKSRAGLGCVTFSDATQPGGPQCFPTTLRTDSVLTARLGVSAGQYVQTTVTLSAVSFAVGVAEDSGVIVHEPCEPPFLQVPCAFILR